MKHSSQYCTYCMYGSLGKPIWYHHDWILASSQILRRIGFFWGTTIFDTSTLKKTPSWIKIEILSCWKCLCTWWTFWLCHQKLNTPSRVNCGEEIWRERSNKTILMTPMKSIKMTWCTLIGLGYQDSLLEPGLRWCPQASVWWLDHPTYLKWPCGSILWAHYLQDVGQVQC